MKVLSVQVSDGLLGRCTAKCYDAGPDTHCGCICRGRNHGRGYDYAREHAREWALEFRRARVDVPPDQLEFKFDDNSEQSEA